MTQTITYNSNLGLKRSSTATANVIFNVNKAVPAGSTIIGALLLGPGAPGINSISDPSTGGSAPNVWTVDFFDATNSGLAIIRGNINTALAYFDAIQVALAGTVTEWNWSQDLFDQDLIPDGAIPSAFHQSAANTVWTINAPTPNAPTAGDLIYNGIYVPSGTVTGDPSAPWTEVGQVHDNTTSLWTIFTNFNIPTAAGAVALTETLNQPRTGYSIAIPYKVFVGAPVSISAKAAIRKKIAMPGNVGTATVITFNNLPLRKKIGSPLVPGTSGGPVSLQLSPAIRKKLVPSNAISVVSEGMWETENVTTEQWTRIL